MKEKYSFKKQTKYVTLILTILLTTLISIDYLTK